MPRALFAQPTVFEATIGHQVGPPLSPPVDVQVARFDFPHEAQGRREVAGEQAGGEPVPRRIRQFDRLGKIGHGRDRDRRAEEFLARDPLGRGDIGQQGGLVQGPLSASSGHHPRASRDRLANPGFHPTGVGFSDHRPHLRGRVEGVTRSQRLDPWCQLVEKVVVHRADHEHPLG